MGTKGSQGPPPWGGSSGDRGGGEDAALPTPALTPSPRTGLPSAGELTSASFWHLRRCSPSGCWEALDWMTVEGKRRPDASRGGVREQAGAQILSPHGAATSSETPTTSGPAAVVWPLGLQGHVYLTIGWAPRCQLSCLSPAPAIPNRPHGPRGYCGEMRHHPLRRSCCHRCCHSHSGRDRHRGRDGPLRPLPGAALRCGGAARARSCAEGNRPAPAGEGRRGGRGRAARRRAEGPVSRARSVLNGLGERIVRPRRRGVGTEKGGWKAETFL